MGIFRRGCKNKDRYIIVLKNTKTPDIISHEQTKKIRGRTPHGPPGGLPPCRGPRDPHNPLWDCAIVTSIPDEGRRRGPAGPGGVDRAPYEKSVITYVISHENPGFRLSDGITYPVLQFLLFPCIPPRYVLEIAGDPAYLDDVVGSAFRADGCMTERAIIDSGKDFVRAVAVVEWTHNFEVFLTAFRAGCIRRQSGGRCDTCSPALGIRNIFKIPVFLCCFFWSVGPFHTISSMPSF